MSMKHRKKNNVHKKRKTVDPAVEALEKQIAQNRRVDDTTDGLLPQGRVVERAPLLYRKADGTVIVFPWAMAISY